MFTHLGLTLIPILTGCDQVDDVQSSDSASHETFGVAKYASPVAGAKLGWSVAHLPADPATVLAAGVSEELDGSYVDLLTWEDESLSAAGVRLLASDGGGSSDFGPWPEIATGHFDEDELVDVVVLDGFSQNSDGYHGDAHFFLTADRSEADDLVLPSATLGAFAYHRLVESVPDVNGDGVAELLAVRDGFGAWGGGIFYSPFPDGERAQPEAWYLGDGRGANSASVADMTGDGVNNVLYADAGVTVPASGNEYGGIFWPSVELQGAVDLAQLPAIWDDTTTVLGRAFPHDVDGDGHKDVIARIGSGAQGIFFGPFRDSRRASEPDVRLEFELADDLVNAGDLNGDGQQDLFLIATDEDDDLQHDNSLVVYAGPFDGVISADSWNARLSSEGGPFSGRGHVVDLNGDSRDEIVLGATSDSTHGENAGALYVIEGYSF
jgi:hypothetical protein